MGLPLQCGFGVPLHWGFPSGWLWGPLALGVPLSVALGSSLLWGFPPGWLWGPPALGVPLRVALGSSLLRGFPPVWLWVLSAVLRAVGAPSGALWCPPTWGAPRDGFEFPSQEHPVLWGATSSAPLCGAPPVLLWGRAAPTMAAVQEGGGLCWQPLGLGFPSLAAPQGLPTCPGVILAALILCRWDVGTVEGWDGVAPSRGGSGRLLGSARQPGRVRAAGKPAKIPAAVMEKEDKHGKKHDFFFFPLNPMSQGLIFKSLGQELQPARPGSGFWEGA